MKRWRGCIRGCVILSVALFLCIPVMAGGYSAKSELKVNVIGLHPCSEEQILLEEILLEQAEEPEQFEDEVQRATPSNATKSNASSTKVRSKRKQQYNENCASSSDADKLEIKQPQQKETEKINRASASDAGVQGF